MFLLFAFKLGLRVRKLLVEARNCYLILVAVEILVLNEGKSL